MQLFNFVLLTGNLTDDPEMSYTPSGTGKVRFSIGHNVTTTNQKTKEVKKHTSFFSCIAWAKTAEFIGEYAKKGQLVHITGTLKQDRWEGKEDKQMHTAVRVIVSKISLGPKSGEGRRDSQAGDLQSDPAGIPEEADNAQEEKEAEKIPF